MPTVNVHEAKTHLSELLAAVERGEEVTIARRGKPIARMVPCNPVGESHVRLGTYEGLGRIDPSFYDDMSEEELADWYGDDESDAS
jgi:prevent-host-death family protein